jgi:hypothetical protein
MAQVARERLGPLAKRVPAEEAPGEEPPRPVIRSDCAGQEPGRHPRPAGTRIVEAAESFA